MSDFLAEFGDQREVRGVNRLVDTADGKPSVFAAAPIPHHRGRQIIELEKNSLRFELFAVGHHVGANSKSPAALDRLHLLRHEWN
jgi:hypothetical protein